MIGCESGCFGKLPCHPDFIGVNAACAEIRQFDRWMQQGLAFAQRQADIRWPTDFEQADPWNFLFHPAGAERYILGRCMPSRDRHGRQYPLLIYLLVHPVHAKAPASAASLIFADFLRASRGLMTAGPDSLDLAMLRSQIEQMTAIPCPIPVWWREQYQQWLRDRCAGDWWDRLFGSFDEPRKYGLYWNLFKMLEPLRKHPGSELHRGLIFPLPRRDDGTDYDIPFWLELIQRVLKQERSPTAYFWNAEAEGRRAFLAAYLSPPSPNVVILLIKPDGQADGGSPLDTPISEPVARVTRRLGASKTRLLQNPDVPLAVFLEATSALG